MKVLCISNNVGSKSYFYGDTRIGHIGMISSDPDSMITIGKWYTSINTNTYNGRLYRIISDNGYHRYYPKELFITMEEYREQKLNDLEL